MKILNHTLGIFTAVVLLTACAASKQGRNMRDSIDGNWTLQTVNTEGINAKFKAQVFNEADLNCFIGSSWNFKAGNSLGNYKLTGGTQGCSTTQRNFRWSIYEPKDAPKEFQFKRLDDKLKPVDDNNGFRLNVTMLEGGNMQLKSAITFEGKPGNIVYNFVKK